MVLRLFAAERLRRFSDFGKRKLRRIFERSGERRSLIASSNLRVIASNPATVSNLRRNPSAEINVVDPMVRKGYRFKGVASVVTEGALYERILDFYRTERNLDEGRTRIRSFVLVKINEAMPLISPNYDQGLTEEQVREKMQHYFDSLQRKNSTTRPEEM